MVGPQVRSMIRGVTPGGVAYEMNYSDLSVLLDRVLERRRNRIESKNRTNNSKN